MCGRYNLRTPTQQLVEFFDAVLAPGVDLAPRYNIAPTQPVAAIRQTERGRELSMTPVGADSRLGGRSEDRQPDD